MAAPRPDFRPSLPQPKPGRAEVHSPTPNILDSVIIEDVAISTNNYAPPIRGTPHPKVAAAILVAEGPITGDDKAKTVRRIYATRRSAQNTYNAKVTFDAGDIAYPIYTRTYFIYQGDYAPEDKNPTAGKPLAEVVSLTVTNAGTGYLSGGSGQIPLVFSGGVGTGAAGYAEVILGIIVAVVLTNGGSYTTAPSATATGGSGLAISTSLQDQRCLLVEEIYDNAQGEFGSIFFEVVKTYKRVPGPVLTAKRASQFGPATLTTQTVAAGTAASNTSATIESSVTSIDEMQSKKETLTADSLPGPWLYKYDTDAETNIGVRTRKRLIANGSIEGGITAAPSATIASVDLLDPCTVTFASPLTIKAGELVTISGNTDASPDINGTWRVLNVLSSTQIQLTFVVSSVSGPSLGSIKLLADWYTDIQELSDRQAIQIDSQADTSTFDNATKTWTDWMQYPYPEQLVGIDVFNNIGTSGAGASPTWPIPSNVSFRTGFTYEGEVAIRTKRYTGKSKVSITRSYFYGTPPVLDAVLQIRTSSGEVISEGGAFEDSRTFSTQVAGDGVLTALSESTRQKATRIENILTSLSSGVLHAGATGQAKVTLKIAASSPTGFTASATFIASADVTPGKLGLFMKEVITVTVPSNY